MLLALVGMLVVLGIGAGIYFLTQNPQLLDPEASAPESSKAEEEAPEAAKEKIKRPSTTADLLEAIAGDIEKNPDTVGWLSVPGTDISDSVQQSYNNSYYLRRTKLQEEDIYGCYFADYECSFGTRDQLSQNTIIYGHSDLKDNKDGPKFSQLFRFTDFEFAANTPYVNFSTLVDGMNWQVFAGFYTDTSMKYIYSKYSDEAFLQLVEEAKTKSVFSYNVPVSAQDKILTLSTCSVRDGTNGNHRFVLMARLVQTEETLSPTADITINTAAATTPAASSQAAASSVPAAASSVAPDATSSVAPDAASSAAPDAASSVAPDA